MPDIIAQGRRPQDRWRRSLPEPGVVLTLGRTSHPWAVSWDDRISRRHATVHWDGTRLNVARLPESRNAIFYQGRQCDQFACAIGEHFVIGQTTFTLLSQQVHFSQVDQAAVAEQTFSAQWLRQNQYRDVGRRIEVLSRLPEIIAGAADDPELCSRVVNLLLEGVPHATFVAILKLRSGYSEESATNDDTAAPSPLESSQSTRNQEESSDPRRLNLAMALEVLHWDCRGLTGHHFSPSAGLVRTASQTRESVLHVWNRSVLEQHNFTQSENVDWAFCTPVLSEACPGWAIYVAGDFPSSTSLGADPRTSDQLQDDLKFAELTATTLGALRQVRVLQRRQDSLRHFFAPVVMEALAGHDPEQVLAPRKTNVSVLFCDLRGFSKESEEANELLELLQRVSGALGVMTNRILSRGGVVGDFHGDAAMGFWGWPIAEASAIEKTCLAALEISREFSKTASEAGHPLANFRAGLGIASGPAVAGRIGTKDQVKVTVFGPVVNLAARLESMTKQLQAPILVDENTAQWIRKHSSPDLLRVRHVARVLPFGMKTPLVVSQLLPPSGPECILTNAHIQIYELALERFMEGNWHEALRLLHQVPAEDQVKDFITFIIAQHHRTAPAHWDGIVRLPEK